MRTAQDSACIRRCCVSLRRVAHAAAGPTRPASWLRDGDLQARQRFHQRGARALVVDVPWPRASRASARRLRLFGARDVDVLGALGELRQDGDPIGQHFGEAERDRQVDLLLPLAVPQLADRERGEHRRVPRQHAEVALGCPGSRPRPPAPARAAVGRHDLQFDVCRERHHGYASPCHLLGLLDRFLDRADHVERLLRQRVVLAVDDLLEALAPCRRSARTCRAGR